MRIIVDAMGGDNAPKEIIKGILSAASKTDDTFILVGNKSEILRCLGDTLAINKQIEIVNAEQIITMDDDPLTAIQKKKDSSMVVALKLLADGKGDALVSAGNTGALFSGATLIVKRTTGINGLQSELSCPVLNRVYCLMPVLTYLLQKNIWNSLHSSVRLICKQCMG